MGINGLSVLYKQKTIRSKVISWWSPARPHFVGWWSHWDHHSQLSTGAHLRPTVQKDINNRTNEFFRDLCSLSTPPGYRKTPKATILYSSAYEAHFCKQSIFAFNFFLSYFNICHSYTKTGNYRFRSRVGRYFLHCIRLFILD